MSNSSLFYLLNLLFIFSYASARFLDRHSLLLKNIDSSMIYKDLTRSPLFFDSKEDLQNLTIKVKCMYVFNFTVYDISTLKKSVIDNDRDYKYAFSTGEEIFYNFCKDIHSDTCSDMDESQVADKSCKPLADSINKGNVWKINKTENESIITMELAEKNESNKKVIFTLECDNNKTKYKEKTHRFDVVDDKCSYTNNEIRMYFKSYYACPKADFYVVWKFISNNKIIFSIVLMIVGLYLAFLGKKYLSITVFGITTIAVIAIVFVFFLQYVLPGGTADWILWVILAISIIVGIAIGYFVQKYKDKVFGILLGCLCGFFLGEFVYGLFSAKITWNPTAVHWIIVVSFMIVLAIISIIFFKFIVIISTSFIGSYLAIRGLSLICGHFPSEFTIIDLASNKETEQLKKLLTWQFYLYLAAIVILTIIAIIVQFKINKKEEEEEEKEKEDKQKLVDSKY